MSLRRSELWERTLYRTCGNPVSNGREGGKTGECAKVRTEVASPLGNCRGGTGSTRTSFLTRSSMRVINIVSDRSSVRDPNREGALRSNYERTPYDHCSTLITAMIGAIK